MALFTIGDTHLALGCDKPMDIFPGWQGYLPRLEAAWRRLVGPEDTVVLAGDISWAMKLENTREDFAFLHGLPGQKLIMKGNHDYWWGTLTKMEQFVTACGFTTLRFLHNNAYLVDGFAVCGTRSWLFDPGQQHDVKIMNRETGRLRASLQAAEKLDAGAEKLTFLHYPPVYYNAAAPEIIDVMNEFCVTRCFYGHLHGASIQRAVQGQQDGIDYRLVSADALRFVPLKIGVKRDGFSSSKTEKDML